MNTRNQARRHANDNNAMPLIPLLQSIPLADGVNLYSVEYVACHDDQIFTGNTTVSQATSNREFMQPAGQYIQDAAYHR